MPTNVISPNQKSLPLLDSRKVDFWLDCNYNVLLEGEKGVGKTAIIESTFKRHKLNYIYFSGATMDAYVDFVGVPRIVQVDGQDFLELLRPAQMIGVQAIFMDELNRAPKAAKNGVMELIQKKSVNGRLYPDLRVVWAGINPFDDDNPRYDVEPLDEALEDRFHIKKKLDYRPCPVYFDQEWKSMGRAAVAWWNSQKAEAQKLVSPRRLEYALDCFNRGGDIEDILPAGVACAQLIESLENGPIQERLVRLHKQKDKVGATALLDDDNMYRSCLPFILRVNDSIQFFLSCVTTEKIIVAMSEQSKAVDYVTKFCTKEPKFAEAIRQVLTANGNAELVKQIKMALSSHNISDAALKSA